MATSNTADKLRKMRALFDMFDPLALTVEGRDRELNNVIVDAGLWNDFCRAWTVALADFPDPDAVWNDSMLKQVNDLVEERDEANKHIVELEAALASLRLTLTAKDIKPGRRIDKAVRELRAAGAKLENP